MPLGTAATSFVKQTKLPGGFGINKIFTTTAEALTWLGRQRTRAVAALVLIAIATPPIGAFLRPFIAEVVFVLLFIAFLRVETEQLRHHLKRPALTLAATAWTTLVIPVLIGAVGHLAGIEALSPDFFLALMLQAIAPPMMAAPAFAILMGLDATLVLITLVASSILTPFTATAFAAVMGLGLKISPSELGIRLFLVLAGAALLAIIFRKIVGPSAIASRKDALDGVNILVLFVFVAAVMHDIGSSFVAMPLVTGGLTAVAFAVFFAIFGLTFLAFTWAGREHAFALGFMASQRNLGLMLAATGGVLPELTWLYFAVGQFPIYLSPYMLRRPAQWIVASDRQAMGRSPEDRG